MKTRIFCLGLFLACVSALAGQTGGPYYPGGGGGGTGGTVTNLTFQSGFVYTNASAQTLSVLSDVYFVTGTGRAEMDLDLFSTNGTVQTVTHDALATTFTGGADYVTNRMSALVPPYYGYVFTNRSAAACDCGVGLVTGTGQIGTMGAGPAGPQGATGASGNSYWPGFSGQIFYVATNGNNATAVVNDTNHPFAPIFCDSSGTQLGGVTALATNYGNKIHLENGTYFVFTIQLTNGITFEADNQSAVTLIPTNWVYTNTAGLNPISSSAYSLLQPGNNCVFQHFTIDCQTTNNPLATNNPLGSILFATTHPYTFQGVVLNDVMVKSAGDTFYYDPLGFLGSLTNRFGVLIKNCTWYLDGDMIYLFNEFADITSLNNNWYAPPPNTNGMDSRIFPYQSATFTDFGSRFYNWGYDNDWIGATIRSWPDWASGNISLNGSIFMQCAPNAFSNLVAQIGQSGTFLTVDAYGNVFTKSLNPAQEAWIPYSTKTNYQYNWGITNIYTYTDGVFFAKFTLEGTSANDWTNSVVTWTNVLGGTRTFNLNNPAATNIFGAPCLSVNENSTTVDWFEPAPFQPENIWAGDSAAAFGELTGVGILAADPQTNSIATNYTYALHSSVLNGTIVYTGSNDYFTLPIFGNFIGATNILIGNVLTNGVNNGSSGFLTWTNGQWWIEGFVPWSGVSGVGDLNQWWNQGTNAFVSYAPWNTFTNGALALTLGAYALAVDTNNSTAYQPANANLTNLASLNATGITNDIYFGGDISTQPGSQTNIATTFQGNLREYSVTNYNATIAGVQFTNWAGTWGSVSYLCASNVPVTVAATTSGYTLQWLTTAPTIATNAVISFTAYPGFSGKVQIRASYNENNH